MAGEAIVTFGTRTKVTESRTVLELPAASVAIALMEFEPGVSVTPHWTRVPTTVDGTPLHVTAARPERLSRTMPAITVSDVNTVEPPVGDVIVNVGAVLSILTVMLVAAVLPALSTAVPEIT